MLRIVTPKERCPNCGFPRVLSSRHPQTGVPICLNCRRVLTERVKEKKSKQNCPACTKPKILDHLHPDTKKHICQACFLKLVRVGKCPDCPPESREKQLRFFDRVREIWICQRCSRKLRRIVYHRKFGRCEKCRHERTIGRHRKFKKLLCRPCGEILNNKPKVKHWRKCGLCPHEGTDVLYRHWEYKFHICRGCWLDLRGKSNRGFCFACGNKRALVRKHWEFDVRICRGCFQRHKEEAESAMKTRRVGTYA